MTRSMCEMTIFEDLLLNGAKGGKGREGTGERIRLRRGPPDTLPRVGRAADL